MQKQFAMLGAESGSLEQSETAVAIQFGSLPRQETTGAETRQKDGKETPLPPFCDIPAPFPPFCAISQTETCEVCGTTMEDHRTKEEREHGA